MSVDVNRWHREVLRRRQALQREKDDALEILRVRYTQDRAALADHFNARLRQLSEPQSQPALRCDDRQGVNG